MSNQEQNANEPQIQEQTTLDKSATQPNRNNSSVDRTLLDRLFRLSMIALTALVLLGVMTTVTRSAVYKIHEYERGLHLRGGRFISLSRSKFQVLRENSG